MTDAASPALDPDTSRLLADARRICSVPAPLHGERPRAELVVQMFEESGVLARIDEIGNVIVWFGPTDEPAAVLAAHVDTVFTAGTPIEFAEGDGRLSATRARRQLGGRSCAAAPCPVPGTGSGRLCGRAGRNGR